DGSCVTVHENLVPETEASFGVHMDQVDNDLDGLIDENQSNHLDKATFINNMETTISVRYINYLNFEVGDTLKRGLIVPNRVIRQRMNDDSAFRAQIENYQAHLTATYGNLSGQFDDYFHTYHTAAPMIDEARNDYFDNDRDWLAIQDDVGI